MSFRAAEPRLADSEPVLKEPLLLVHTCLAMFVTLLASNRLPSMWMWMPVEGLR